METKVNYTVVGFFVVVLTIAIIVIGLWLTENLKAKSYETYRVYMNESVAGLSDQAAVKYNGVEVGYVSDIRLNLENPQQAILELKIETHVPVTASTQAVLMQQGITGIAYIGLQGGNPGEKLLRPQPGGKYPVIKSVPSFLVRLDQTIQNLSENMNGLSKNVRRLLDTQNLQCFRDTLKNLDEISSTIAHNNQQINQSIRSFDVLLRNTSEASKNLPELIKEMKTASDSLASMSNSVVKTAQKGDVAIDSVSSQLLPQAYSAMHNIQGMTSNLEGLSEELKQNPSIILRGKSQSAPGPGER